METDYKLYYSHFQENAVDTQRAAAFDAIISDPEFPAELKNKMQDWKRVLVTIKNMDENMAKSFVVSFVRFIMLSDEERKQAKRMGVLHNSIMPTTKERG